jgi:prolyl-tRNA synthetase
LKYSSIHPKTRKEDPKSVVSAGTKLLMRGGFIEQISSGLWTIATLGLRVKKNIESIVRDEMNKSGAIEFEFPILQPKELWEESGRWSKYIEANIAFKLSDRKRMEYFLAPTAEEVVTNFARKYLKSYRDLPSNIWQMNQKFRDEIRPRQGLIRNREFLMKDAYSFNESEASMVNTYNLMGETYKNIFTRCGLNFIKVEADSGSIGGNNSSEFMALTDIGEDTLLYCEKCGYGANQEKAVSYLPEYSVEENNNLIELETPDIKTVEELFKFTNIPENKMIKTVVLEYDGKPVIISIRGDLQINETKIINILNATKIRNASPEMVEKATNAPVGFAGPINLYKNTDIPYFFDNSTKGLKNFLCGGNKKDYHYLNVNFGRDLPEPDVYHDLSKSEVGHICPNCKESKLNTLQGIEIGHIFQLGQTYSKSMNAKFVDNTGKEDYFYMGCYGIGVSRIVQTIVEQSYDNKGIIWPINIAPFKVTVIPINQKEHLNDAINIYNKLNSLGISTLIDDTESRVGEKFINAELLGIPLQIIVGKSWQLNQKLEIKWRNSTKFDESVFSIKKENGLPSCEIGLDELESLLRKVSIF